ncbi:MAG: hypothetical protein J6W60_11610 [Treponema sp.]|nr:hypothetical protein [Treponema sp.]MBP5753483.1 hypothetical protein [Treponema sp.]
MCEIMTIAAAVIFTVVFALQKKKGVFSKPVFGTMLMFWGAALMWAVDGIASVLEGESFFDISMEDTILGFIILGAGLVIFAFMLLLNRAKKARA